MSSRNLITLVPGFDPVPVDAVVVATYHGDAVEVRLKAYPGGWSVEVLHDGDPVEETTYAQEVVAYLAYDQACDNAWTSMVRDLDEAGIDAAVWKAAGVGCVVEVA